MEPINRAEIIIANQNAEFEDFYKYAEVFESKMNIAFLEKVHDYDSLYWTFLFMNCSFILNYDTFDGISIYADDDNYNREHQNIITRNLEGELRKLNLLSVMQR